MRTLPLLARALSALCLAVLALAFLQPAAEGTQTSYHSVASANPAFLSAQALPAALLLPAMSPLPPGNLVSALSEPPGGPKGTCSVVESTAQPSQCSAGQATGMRRCSIRCDQGGLCSAIGNAAAPSPLECSTFGDTNQACSVVSLPASAAPSSTLCSVIGVDVGISSSGVRCSALGSGTYQVCSTVGVNPPVELNFCSAILNSQGTGEALCSALVHAAKSACSTFGPAEGKTCSTFNIGSSCSVYQTADSFTGKCTALRLAPDLSCSAFSDARGEFNCSVINGSNGTVCGAH